MTNAFVNYGIAQRDGSLQNALQRQREAARAVRARGTPAMAQLQALRAQQGPAGMDPMGGYGVQLAQQNERVIPGTGVMGNLARNRDMRRKRAFYEEQDRREAELERYGRELGPFDRLTTTLPRSDSPADVQSTLASVMGGQFAGGIAGTALANPGRAIASAMNPQRPSGFIPMTTYHGSPHRINNIDEANPMGRFDMSKIGTGEGAQAYGHGIYLAENPEVARTYVADRSSVGNFMRTGMLTDPSIEKIAQDAVDTAVSPEEAANQLRRVLRANSQSKNPKQMAYNDEIQQAIDMINSGAVSKKGSFYTVDLPDEHIANMLDWDAPLSKQPESVRNALYPYIEMLRDDAAQSGSEWGKLGDPDEIENIVTGGDAYKVVAQQARDAALAKLQTYKEQLGRLSRIMDEDSGPGYRNFRSDRGRQAAAEYDRLMQARSDTVDVNATNLEGARGMQAIASDELRRAGVPGIKYFDAMSRKPGEGTRNFVIFDPDIVKILNRE